MRGPTKCTLASLLDVGATSTASAHPRHPIIGSTIIAIAVVAVGMAWARPLVPFIAAAPHGLHYHDDYYYYFLNTPYACPTFLTFPYSCAPTLCPLRFPCTCLCGSPFSLSLGSWWWIEGGTNNRFADPGTCIPTDSHSTTLPPKKKRKQHQNDKRNQASRQTIASDHKLVKVFSPKSESQNWIACEFLQRC